MRKLWMKLTRRIRIGWHFLGLIFLIIKTWFVRWAWKMQRESFELYHLKTLVERRNETRENLASLVSSLYEQQDDKLIIADTLEKQQVYFTKDELVSSLPRPTESTEIIAIPIAIMAFSLFRHFVTVIIDLRENVVEFYDPLGFSVLHHQKAKLWGHNCSNGTCLTLLELIVSIKYAYQIDMLVESRAIHQQDFYQCAIYVYDRIYKRSTLGLSFEQASRIPLPPNHSFITPFIKKPK